MNRRTVLKGLSGVSLALPFLEAFAPRSARAQPAVNRFGIFMRQGNGVAQATPDGEPERFWFRNTGALTTVSMQGEADRSLSVLAPFASRLCVVKGIDFPNGDNHGPGGAQCLTGHRVWKAPGADDNKGNFAEGESIDNRIARTLTPGVEPLTLYAGPMFGYVNEVLSFRGPRDRRGAERNPYTVYARLMGVTNADQETQRRIALGRLSVNDLVRGQLRSLLANPRLSSRDRRVLDQHLTAVRDVEVKASCMASAATTAGLAPFMNSNYQPNWVDGAQVANAVKLHCDIIAMAVACGACSAATLQIGDGLDLTRHTVRYNNAPMTLGEFHSISHRATCDACFGDAPNPGQMAEFHALIDRDNLQLYAYLLEQLQTRGVLDNGVCVFLSDVGNKFHHVKSVPYVVAGSAGGYLKTGQFVDAGGAGPNRLLNTLLNAVGVRKTGGALVDDFGDPNLPKGELTALKA